MAFNLSFTVPLILLVSTHIDEYKLTNTSDFFDAHLPYPIVLFLTIFCSDFIGYWRHRLEHSKALWPSHAVHHSDTQMTWLTLERFHPINRVSTYVIDSTLLLLFGFPTEAIIASNMMRHYYGYFIHADVPWSYGEFWGKVFVSPTMHQWHHAAAHSMHNKNFATIFAFIDYAFNTYSVPGPCESNLGVSYKYKLGVLDQLASPFKLSSYKKYNFSRQYTRQNKEQV